MTCYQGWGSLNNSYDIEGRFGGLNDMELVLGMLIGSIATCVFLIVKKSLKRKKGVKDKDYSRLSFTTKLRDTVRHIVYEYDIKSKNKDFLLNIDLRGETVIQLMHRAHFPALCQKESDIAFGIALYIPVKGWPSHRVEKLEKIIDEETETFKKAKSGQLEYFIVDLGDRVRFGGYFLSRIIKEVFDAGESEFNSSLFSEGNLPYWQN